MKRDTKAFLREAVLTGATLAFCAAMPFAGLHAAAAIVTAPPVASNEVSARGPAVVVDKLAAYGVETRSVVQSGDGVEAVAAAVRLPGCVICWRIWPPIFLGRERATAWTSPVTGRSGRFAA